MLCACTPGPQAPDATASPDSLNRKDAKSGYHYLSADEQALQDDSFANPGLLWVDAGEALFSAKGDEAACSNCHTTNDMDGVAARYPAYDPNRQQLLTLEQRVNACRTREQQPAWGWESDNMLSITAWLGRKSLGVAITPDTSHEATLAASRGRDYYYARKGQLNLACYHCHEQNPGKMLRGDRLSQGMPTGYPAYKLDWQTLGSLQRRLRDCNAGVRATVLDYGAQEYVDLEAFLKARAAGLPMDVPAVRR